MAKKKQFQNSSCFNFRAKEIICYLFSVKDQQFKPRISGHFWHKLCPLWYVKLDLSALQSLFHFCILNFLGLQITSQVLSPTIKVGWGTWLQIVTLESGRVDSWPKKVLLSENRKVCSDVVRLRYWVKIFWFCIAGRDESVVQQRHFETDDYETDATFETDAKF